MSDADRLADRADAGAPSGGFRHLAVCLDGSELGERVLPHARAFAGIFGAQICFVRVLETHTGVGAPVDPVDWELRRKEASNYLDQIAGSCGELPTAVEVIEGTAADQISRWSEHHDVDLTLLSSHGDSGTNHCRLAATSSRVIEQAPGSVLLVPARAMPLEGGARYRRILVPLDGSARAESVLTIAAQLAEFAGGEIMLTHVVPIPELIEIGALEAEDIDLRDRLVARNERVAHRYLDRVRAGLAERRLSVRALVLRSGEARGRLVRLIEDLGVDLVVLSAHGRTGRADVPCGSVAAHLMTHSSAPLLIVRPRAAQVRAAASLAEAPVARRPELASA